MTTILNDDFVNFAFEFRQRGYTLKQIASIAIDKFKIKNCSEKTVQRAIKKKIIKTGQKQDNNRTETGQ